MTASARSIRAAPPSLPTLEDVASGKVSLDEYEAAHGEDIPELTEEDLARARPTSDVPQLAAAFERARQQPVPPEEPVNVSPPVAVRYDARNLVISLKDGRELSVPLTWYPDLVNAPSAQRAAVEFTPTSVRWVDLGEEASIADILRTKLKIANLERARGQRGPQKAPTKERIGLRLDSEVVTHFRATGPGWQSRINDILREHLKRGGN